MLNGTKESPFFSTPAHVIQTTQGKLSYRTQGDGPILIFLHGLLGSSKAFRFQLEAFSEQYQVVAWDAPGYGQSDLIPALMPAYEQALADLIDALGQPTVNIVGHSMGGSVASAYAAHHPERVARLVLSCTHPGYGDPESAPMSEKFEQRMAELQEIGAEAYGWNRARDLLPFPEVPEATLAYAAQVASETIPEGLRRATRMLQLADNRALLPQLSMPVLVLTGEQDKVVQPHLKADLLRLTPFKEHIEMPGLAHAPYFQNPEYYNAQIRQFLATY